MTIAELGTLRATLAIALEDLSPEQRDAVRLRVIDELDYPAIARRLGISEDAVRARVSRGLRTLAVALTRFLEACPVLRSEPVIRDGRLALVALTARVLAQGLDLLGIQAPSRL